MATRALPAIERENMPREESRGREGQPDPLSRHYRRLVFLSTPLSTMSDDDGSPPQPPRRPEEQEDEGYDPQLLLRPPENGRINAEAPSDTSPVPASASMMHPRSNRVIDPLSLDALNGQLHLALISGDYSTCKSLAAEIEATSHGNCEYAKIVRGQMAREEGNLDEAEKWFREALELNPDNDKTMVELGRVHHLAGRNEDAASVLEQAIYKNRHNARAYYWLSRSLYNLSGSGLLGEKARDLLTAAPGVKNNPETLSFLARMWQVSDTPEAAVAIYQKLIQMEPEVTEHYTELGLLQLRMGEETDAFGSFGMALSYKADDPGAIMGAGYIMQLNGDHDVALNKYRVVASACEYDGNLWNNIGMCLYAKNKVVSAISCLKKAAYLQPLDPKILFNLGLVHIAMSQPASTFHYLKAAQTLKPKDPIILTLMALALTKLGDITSARKAYERAIESSGENKNPQLFLNAAIFEFNHGSDEHSDAAMRHIDVFRSIQMDRTLNHSMYMISIADRLQNAILDRNEKRLRAAEERERLEKRIEATQED